MSKARNVGDGPLRLEEGRRLLAGDDDDGAQAAWLDGRVRLEAWAEVAGAGDAARGSHGGDLEDGEGAAAAAAAAHHRVPLLTDREAPSVAVANAWGDGGGGGAADEVHATLRRPKSGLRSAFMNMANSIIGAGIIGQPYAVRQAGLLAGVALLVGLTALVDWTVRLLVINSKLSGTSSFQGTVEHCFGRAGLVAISVAQWVFAFGGMVAFGVIVGDTIPHVLVAVWPGLASVPVLGLLTDRRAAIAVFVLGVSYPLTLYRDIAKVRASSRRGHEGRLADETTGTRRSWPRRARLRSWACSSSSPRCSRRVSWRRPRPAGPSARLS